MSILSGSAEKKILPVVAVRDGIVFPHTENVLLFGREKSVQAVNQSVRADSQIVVVLQRNSALNEPSQADLYEVGVLASIQKVLRGDKGEISALVKGISKVRILKHTQDSPFFQAEVEEIKDTPEETDETAALIKHITQQLKRAVNLGKGIDFVFLMNVISGVSAEVFSNQIATVLDLKTKEKQDLLEESSPLIRLKKEAEYIGKEVKVLELEHNIRVKTQKKFEKGMKDAVLREKLKTIEKELGGEGKEDPEIRELRLKIKKAKMPEEAEKKAYKELERLAQMSQYNPEASYIRTYLELLSELPWSSESKGNVNVKKAEKILNEDHYGLKKVKERILEYLAVMKLKKGVKSSSKKRKDRQPTILCFAGPPGVGKTSLGRSIARALDREFVKMSLGGIRDEAEIRGHRRTYVGALPGRIIQGIKQAGTRNPIFMLDEIDKVGHDYRGDPSSALLEALDPEQNFAFSDHYLEVDFDLSNVMFVTTANILDTIPSALRDRLEIIHFPGYTEDEKFNIVKRFLVKKQLSAHGLNKKNITIRDDALKIMIQRYTREAGVRELERQVAKIFRKVARDVVEKNAKKVNITKANITTYSGPFKYSSQMIEEKDSVGISTGLAWTQAGGDILFIEVATMPGKGNLTLTGHLGDVMKESCRAALSYIRARWKMFGLDEKFYNGIDIHVHVPEGAVPKDGPSAGIAITSAMISALASIPIDRYVGMTGEITLRGRVMEIGGIKEKVIAAHRAGLKKVILPKENKKDLDDIPKYVLKDLKFVFVDHMDQVLQEALVFPTSKSRFPYLKMPN